MADKLVAVRVKQQDNTYSNEIPIGAKAENVAYDNTKNLLQVLGTIDMYKGDVQTQLNVLFEDFNGIAEDVAGAIDDWITENMPSWDPEEHLDDTLTSNTLAPVSSAVPKLIAVNEAAIQGTKMIIDTTGQEDLTVLTPNDIDATLSIEGAVADAKATGDAISDSNATMLAAMAPTYSTSATYSVGDYVNYDNAIYRCTTAITTAEPWTAGNWTAVILGEDLEDQISNLKESLTTIENKLLYDEFIDFSQAEILAGYIRYSDYKWIAYRSAESAFIAVPVDAKKIKITANEVANAHIQFLTTNEVTPAEIAPLCSAISAVDINTGTTEEFIIPSDCAYVCITFARVTETGCEPDSAIFYIQKNIPEIDNTLTQSGAAADAQVTGNAINDLNDSINDLNDLIYGDDIIVTRTVTLEGPTGCYRKSYCTAGKSFIYDSTETQPPFGPSISRCNHTDPDTGYDISEFAGVEITLTVEALETNNSAAFCFADGNQLIIADAVYATSEVLSLNNETGLYEGTVMVPTNAKYLAFSVRTPTALNSQTLTITTLYSSLINRIETLENNVDTYLNNSHHTMHISTTGNDANDGLTSASAMATVNEALKSGADTIIIEPGVYEQQIDMSYAGNSLRIVSGSPYAMTVFKAPNSLIASDATLVSGYTRVYSCSSNKNYANTLQIYQEGVADVSTAITSNESHPLQRGKTYRCDEETMIAKCTATTLTNALTEIENASDYRFYYDTANQALYFSSPHEVTAEYPLRGSFGETMFSNIPRGLKFSMTSISVKYMSVKLTNTSDFELADCSCGNVYGEGAFVWNFTTNAKFTRCEAYRTYYTATTGDGFNGHGNNASTIDQHVKETTCTLIDCWAHDNLDDGYSDHEHCEITLIGGLYEYNGAGVTPAAGSNCTCYNVYARFNHTDADFYYTSSENAVGGRFICYSCISEGDGSGDGFKINGGQNRALFYNCIVMNRVKGFASQNPNRNGSQVVQLINCSTYNVTTPRESHMTVISGVAIT